MIVDRWIAWKFTKNYRCHSIGWNFVYILFAFDANKNQVEIVLWIKFSCRQNQFSLNFFYLYFTMNLCTSIAFHYLHFCFVQLFKCLNIRFFVFSRQRFNLKKNVCPQFMTETLVVTTTRWHSIDLFDGKISIDVCVYVYEFFFLCKMCDSLVEYKRSEYNSLSSSSSINTVQSNSVCVYSNHLRSVKKPSIR